MPTQIDEWIEANPVPETRSTSFHGFLAPFTLGMGHCLFLLGRVKDSRIYPNPLITEELTEAASHFYTAYESLYRYPGRTTLEFTNKIRNLYYGTQTLLNEYQSYSNKEEFVRYLTRFCFVGASILIEGDRELLGLTDSTYGSVL